MRARGSPELVHASSSGPERGCGDRTAQCYRKGMNAVRGTVRNGQIATDSPLPEGAEVVVLRAADGEPFDLDEAQLTELETRMAEANRGEHEPASAVLERLRRAR